MCVGEKQNKLSQSSDVIPTPGPISGVKRRVSEVKLKDV